MYLQAAHGERSTPHTRKIAELRTRSTTRGGAGRGGAGRAGVWRGPGRWVEKYCEQCAGEGFEEIIVIGEGGFEDDGEDCENEDDSGDWDW